MGLLDFFNNLDDPNKAALASMAFGLLSPKPYKTGLLQDVGQAGLLGMQTYGEAKQQNLVRQKETQQNKLLDIQTQLAQQTLDREKARAAALQGAFGPPDSQPPGMPPGLATPPSGPPGAPPMANPGYAPMLAGLTGVSSPSAPSPSPAPSAPADPRAAMRDLYYRTAQTLAAKGFGDDAQKYFDMAIKLEDEFNPSPVTMMKGGQPTEVLVSKQGKTRDLTGYSPKPDFKQVNTGDRVGFVDPLSGAQGPSFGVNMSPADRARISIDQQDLALKKFNADPLGMFGINPNGVGANNPAAGRAAQGASGEDYIGSLPKPVADQVKALAEGRMQFPGGFALKSPYWQSMLSMVSQYDPSFDAVNYGARAATRKDFTSGNAAKSINALNTVAGHLDELSKAVDALDNSNFTPYNAVANPVRKAFGSTGPTNFQAVLQTVMPELERAYRGSGGSEGSLQRWQSALSGTNGLDQQKSAIKEIAGLLQSKIQALGDQYGKGMGTTSDGLQLLSPKSQGVFHKLLGQGGDSSGFRVLGKE